MTIFYSRVRWIFLCQFCQTSSLTLTCIHLNLWSPSVSPLLLLILVRSRCWFSVRCLISPSEPLSSQFFLSHCHFLQNSCNYSSIPLTIAFNLDTSILHTNVCSPLVTAPILRRCRDDTPDSYSGLFWTLTIYYFKQLTRQDRLINPGSTFQQWVSLSQLPVIMKTDFKI